MEINFLFQVSLKAITVHDMWQVHLTEMRKHSTLSSTLLTTFAVQNQQLYKHEWQ
jgi:hypothetical protein